MAELVAAAVQMFSWKVSVHYGGDGDSDHANVYVTNLLALLSVLGAWLDFLGHLRSHLPLFSSFVPKLQRQLAEDIGEALLLPGMHDVKPDPGAAMKQLFSQFGTSLEHELRSNAHLVLNGILMADLARIEEFKKLTFSAIPFGARCEEFDWEYSKLLVNCTKEMIEQLTEVNLSPPDSQGQTELDILHDLAAGCRANSISQYY